LARLSAGKGSNVIEKLIGKVRKLPAKVRASAAARFVLALLHDSYPHSRLTGFAGIHRLGTLEVLDRVFEIPRCQFSCAQTDEYRGRGSAAQVFQCLAVHSIARKRFYGSPLACQRAKTRDYERHGVTSPFAILGCGICRSHLRQNRATFKCISNPEH